MTELEALGQVMAARSWWPAVSGVVVLLLLVLRRVAPAQWARLPRRWQWVPAVLLALLGGATEAIVRGADWRETLAAALYAVIAVGLPAIGLYHSSKRIGPGGGPELPALELEREEPTAPPTLRGA